MLACNNGGRQVPAWSRQHSSSTCSCSAAGHLLLCLVVDAVLRLLRALLVGCPWLLLRARGGFSGFPLVRTQLVRAALPCVLLGSLTHTHAHTPCTVDRLAGVCSRRSSSCVWQLAGCLTARGLFDRARHTTAPDCCCWLTRQKCVLPGSVPRECQSGAQGVLGGCLPGSSAPVLTNTYVPCGHMLLWAAAGLCGA